MSVNFPMRRLPSQPSLEQLRKQAKDLLNHYRAGEPSAVEEVQRIEREPDPESFALNDSQRVLARAYGYESWTKLKAFVDGVNLQNLVKAVKAHDMKQVRVMLNERPELVQMEVSGGDEHRALHFAVLGRDREMVKLLMEAGADARVGIFPHRDATSALAIAKDREYTEIVAAIEEEERLRREEMSCPNAMISPKQERIHRAIHDGDNATAVALLTADGSLIHACDRNGCTPLHAAAEVSNEEMIDWLLKRNAKINKEDMRGWTPLDRATLAADPRNDRAAGFPAVARKLAEHGANITIRGAVAMGDASRVRELIRENPSALRELDGMNGGLLSLAVNHGQLQMASLLLDLGADVNERTLLSVLEEPTQSWGTPLWYAALAGSREMVELLLDRGADPNANVYASGWPLRNAWNQEDDSVKRLLLERGAKPTPYMVAEAHDVEEARRLLANDANEEVARELAWSAADHGCSAIVEMAIAGLSWPASDPRWHWVLIQPIRGINPKCKERDGHFRAMEVLLKHGVDPNITRLGQTVLHFAAARHGEIGDQERVTFAAMLLDFGARFDLRDDILRSTPLGWACRWGRKELAELLVARGAPIDEPDAESWAQPRAWARKMKREELLAALLADGS